MAGSKDEMVRDVDEEIMDYGMEKDSSSYSLNENSVEEAVSSEDFSDMNYDRRSGRQERRNSPFGDRRKEDRRRASRHDASGNGSAYR